MIQKPISIPHARRSLGKYNILSILSHTLYCAVLSVLIVSVASARSLFSPCLPFCIDPSALRLRSPRICRYSRPILQTAYPSLLSSQLEDVAALSETVGQRGLRPQGIGCSCEICQLLKRHCLGRYIRQTCCFPCECHDESCDMKIVCGKE